MAEKLKINLECDGTKVTLTLPDDLQIDEPKLNQQVADQPGLYAYFALISVRLALKRDIFSQALKDTQAAAGLRIRETAAATGEKTTEDKIAAKVSLDPTVQKARKDLQDVERQSAEAALVKEAFYQRLQALITLSANVRKEQSQTSST